MDDINKEKENIIKSLKAELHEKQKEIGQVQENLTKSKT